MAHVERHRRRRPDGTELVTWRARWRDPAGRERAKTFRRKLDAERHLIGVEDAKLRGAYIDPRLGKTRFEEVAERWWATTAGLRPGTRMTYRRLLDGHVLPAFGGRPLAGIDRLAVAEWVGAMLANGVTPGRARDAYRICSAILAAAVAGGLLAANPATGIKLPRLVHREACFLTAAEVERLADTIAPGFRVLVLMAAYSGLRAGELAALRVGRLDLLGGRVEVVESTSEVNGHLVTGPPKSGTRRVARLPRFLCEELAAHLARRPHAPGDLVFTMTRGGQLRQSSLLESYFRPAVSAAGLDPRLRFHDLRHTCASLLIAQGASVKAVQAQLGHATATMTLDRYGHLFPDELDHLADRLDQARAEAVADPLRTRSGPEVVALPSAGG
jgi:integrase